MTTPNLYTELKAKMLAAKISKYEHGQHNVEKKIPKVSFSRPPGQENHRDWNFKNVAI